MKKHVLTKTLEKKRLETESQILEDLRNNKFLERHLDLPIYYKSWIDGSRLVAVIPALQPDDDNSKSYFSVSSIDKTSQLSPVFLYKNNYQSDNFLDSNPKDRLFVFDSEFSNLYSYVKQKQSSEYHFVKKSGFDLMAKHINENPIVLFFYGCDDGHVGKRFKTEEDAFDYLEMLNVFEDVFEDKDLQSHN